MNETLAGRVRQSLAREVPEEVAETARRLGEEAGGLGVLFYGSNLRTTSLEGVLDFYVLLPGAQVEKIWPRVSYREWQVDGVTLRAKIATMALETFERAASGTLRDTTIWARFVQPSALIWACDDKARDRIASAVENAAKTASLLAAALGPAKGAPDDYWRALFRATYKAEFRIEKPGREDAILEVNRDHFDGLLPLGWEAQGIAFARTGELLRPTFGADRRERVLKWWAKRRRFGKPLNIARLAKATTTFDGAADYAAWKLHRHTGIALEVTPFRARHPLLAMPGAAWELWRRKRAQR